MQKSPRYDNLDALRALGAIGILLMHYLSNIAVKPAEGWFTDTLIPWMTNFVILFFVLSAFGISCGYYERFRTGAVTPSQFYARRYRRILPFFILLSAIEIGFSFSWQALAEGFMNSTLTLGFMPVPQVSVIGVGWFLGTIFVFYIAYPFFVYLLSSRAKAWLMLGLAYVLNLLCYYYFFTPDYDVAFNPGRNNILYSALFLLSGGLLYLYRGDIYRLNSRRGGAVATGVAAAALTVGYFVALPHMGHAANMAAITVMFAGWMVYAVSPGKRWMDNRVMRFLGKYSMEIYLSHMVVFRAIERLHLERHIADAGVCYWVTCAIGLGVTVVFAYVAVKVLDRAGSALRRRPAAA